jgi:hypothetical protein
MMELIIEYVLCYSTAFFLGTIVGATATVIALKKIKA